MKRIVSIALVAFMLLAIVPLSASASTPSYALNIDVPEAYKAGDVIEVDVEITDVALQGGISFLNFILRYDNDKFMINATAKHVPCLTEDFYSWEDLTTVNGAWNDDKTQFIPANDGEINVNIGDGGGSGDSWHNLSSGESIVLHFSFTALEDAGEDANIWVNGNESTAAVFNQDSEYFYDEYQGIGDDNVVEETIVYNENAVEGGHIPGAAADCENDQVCTGCGEVLVTALGHKYADTVVAPTCTEGGYTYHECSVCGDNYTDNEVEANGHDYEDTVTPPTCTEGGYTYHKCSVCGDDYTDSEVEANGHSYVDTVTPPTCTEGGHTYHECSVCGDNYTDSEVEANGHEDGEWVVIEEADYGVAGLQKKYCIHCGEETQSEEIPALQYERGDVNADGKLSATDYLMLKTVVLGTKNYEDLKDPETAEYRCDYSPNGKVNASDYFTLKKFILN